MTEVKKQLTNPLPIHKMIITDDEVKQIAVLTESIVEEIAKVSAGVDHSYKWQIVDCVETSNKLTFQCLDKLLYENTSAKSAVVKLNDQV